MRSITLPSNTEVKNLSYLSFMAGIGTPLRVLNMWICLYCVCLLLNLTGFGLLVH
jgi:hypothetical protein